MNKEQLNLFDNTGVWLINQFKSVLNDVNVNGFSVEKHKKWNEIENRLIQWQRDFKKIKFETENEEGEWWKHE